MENNSTTDVTDNQTDSTIVDNQTDPNTSTDTQTANNSDNLDTSTSTDDSANDGSEEDTPPKFDDDLDQWAAKTGRKAPENDTDREYLQDIRNAQREYTRTHQKNSAQAVSKAIQEAKPEPKVNQDDEDIDPLEKRVQAAEARLAEAESQRARSEFFTVNEVTAEEAKIMGEILKEKSDKGGQAAFDYWTNPENLQDWYDLAKFRLSKEVDTSHIEEAAARSERERIAREQQANSPSRNATQTTTVQKTLEQERLERFSKWD